MTFAEAKDIVALKHYNAPFKDVHFYEHKWKICEEAAELYAASVREEAVKCPGCGSTHRICQNCMLITH